jgi:hypothetical protein
MHRGALLRWSIVDETYVKVAGERAYLYRAVDQHGQVIDVLLSVRRDLAEPPPNFQPGTGVPDQGCKARCKANCGISGDQQ